MSPLQTQGIVLPIICALLGTCISVSVWGRNSEERNSLTQQLNKFQSLEAEQKNNVRKSYALLKSMPARKQTEIEQIHQQTQANPELQKTMDRYFEWWSSLSQAEWDSFEELDAEERLAFVKSRWRKPKAASPKEIVVEFTGPSTVRMPPLRLSFADYWSIIAETVPNELRDDKLQKELEQLKSDDHRALLLTLSLFERFNDPSKRRELEHSGSLLKTALLKHVKDKAWLSRFRPLVLNQNPKNFQKFFIVMTTASILDKATIVLGDDLRKQFPVTSEEMVQAFESLPNETDADRSFKRALMTMPPDEARERLELLAQTTSNQSPEHQLVNRYKKSVGDRQRFRWSLFGFENSEKEPPVPEKDLESKPSRSGEGPPRPGFGRRPLQ